MMLIKFIADGLDYSVLSDFTIIFDETSNDGTTECFDVPILNNLALENTEQFSLSITSVEDNVLLAIANLVIHINDDDSK